MTRSGGFMDWRAGPLWERLTGRRGGDAEARSDRLGQHRLPQDDPAGLWRRYRLPVVVTALWLVALGGYAAGYVARLGEADAGRVLPTLDLLFFAFAVAGPVAMLWMVALLHARAAMLSDALTAQGESALALADTLSNLHDAVDGLTAGTTGKLSAAFARVEKGADASADRLDRAVGELGRQLETSLFDSAVMLERSLRERTAGMDAALETQREALAGRIDADAARLADRIEAELKALSATQAALAERMEAGLAERRADLDRGIAETLAHFRGRLDHTAQQLEDGLVTLATDLAKAQDERHRELNRDIGRRQERLRTAIDAMARTVDGEIAPVVVEVRRVLAETRDSVAANPPATTDELGALLGAAADRQIAPERAALIESVGRIAALEQRAEDLLARIDRTSRLNPLMEGPGGDAAGKRTDAPPELPFVDLGVAPPRTPLDWTAAIRALDARDDGRTGPKAVERALADADIATLVGLGRSIAEALSEDGLHLVDLAPEHAPAGLWARFGRGERGGDVGELAGIGDPVARAIARARLRDDPAFAAMAMRLVAAYTRLIERAVAEIGADPRLVEMAETPPGRAFMLLGGLTRAFSPVPQAADTDG